MYSYSETAPPAFEFCPSQGPGCAFGEGAGGLNIAGATWKPIHPCLKIWASLKCSGKRIWKPPRWWCLKLCFVGMVFAQHERYQMSNLTQLKKIQDPLGKPTVQPFWKSCAPVEICSDQL